MGLTGGFSFWAKARRLSPQTEREMINPTIALLSAGADATSAEKAKFLPAE